MSNFKKNNKIISTLLLFVMIFQIGFTSASFASERNEIYTGFVDSPYCDDLSKEDIAMIMELINDPEVQAIMDELFLEFSKDKNRHSRKIKWTQADDVLAGLIDGVKDEVGDLVDGVASIFKVSTYKGIISLCKALVTEEITLKELGKYLVKDALEPFEYVIEHGDEIFSGEEVSDTVVRKFSKNLGKCVLTILASSKLTAKVVDKVDGFGKIAKKFKKVEDKLDGFACFTQGTKVLTDNGLKNIEDIKVNDLVFAKDVENNKKDYKIVKELYQNKVDTILKLNIDGQIINTTLNHPFYKKDIGFVEASKLEVNDVLLNSNDEEVKVLAKEEISFDEGIVVYNLNVEDYHTYYVGSNNVLVHNKCWVDDVVKIKKAKPEKLVNILSKFRSKRMTFGSKTFLLDKSGMKHILERHHPKYWNGSIKKTQSFLDESMDLDDISDAIKSVMSQNRSTLVKKGTKGMYQVRGSYKGNDYVVGFKNGRVGQFYPE